MKKFQSGATLLEVMLVIVIGAAILYMSIQQYLTYRRDADALQVQANVDTIFQAMSSYYRMNCYGTTDGSYQMVAGTLNQAISPPNPLPISISTDLIDNGFLTTPMPRNPIVKPTGAGTNGYVAQFNRFDPPQDRQTCMAGTNATTPLPPNCTDPRGVGKIITWKAQVAVQLNNPTPTEAKLYLNLLAGDCLSTMSGSTVVPCSTSGNTGTFVVWEKLPSSGNAKFVSDYWVTMPTVSQFTQMYTTAPILNLTDGSSLPYQYYLCGN
ncbi:type IV pilin protein [Aquicella siphonis]|nr:type II secretion system protein [Aquicella siphonis]